VEGNAVIGEPLAATSTTAPKGNVIKPDEALRSDPRYTSFDDQGKVTGYVVQGGDTLSTISGQEAIYGKTTLWPLIYSANRKVIGNSPKKLKTKQQLVIPRDYTEEQAKEAEKKAGRR
jgi:nucleoid-associated protein YgaU